MDFSFSEEQTMVRDLARGILEKEVTDDRIKAIVDGPDDYDTALWSTLAEAGLLGLAVDEEHGGMGVGFECLCVFLAELGRVVAPTPALAVLAMGSLAVSKFGTAEQKAALLPGLASGDSLVTAAWVDAGSSDPSAPATTATKTKEDDGWELSGRKLFVQAGGVAQTILVPATSDEGVGIFVVAGDAPGLTRRGSRISNGETLFELDLNDVVVSKDSLLGASFDKSGERLQNLYQHALVAVSAMQVGLSERALHMTAAYLTERVQFGVPIGSFQSVQHRCADCYIDVQAMEWTTWRAAWKLANDRPASRDAAVAKYWAAEGGARVANAAQHLHGGMGVDMDYALPRYFLTTKVLELTLGGAARQVDWLGRDMARTGPNIEGESAPV